MGDPGPSTLMVVVGTSTEVGKTWVTARLIERLRDAGVRVSAHKPAQSFDQDDAAPTDAAVLGAASGEDPTEVCPPHRWYPVAMAPPMAADALGLPRVVLADLIGEIRARTSDADLVLIETAGGVRSPLAHDGDAVDLIAALGPALVLLVADAGLGTINAVRLSAAGVAEQPGENGRTRTVVFLNRFDPGSDLHSRNLAWLEAEGLAVTTTIDSLVAPVLAAIGR